MFVFPQALLFVYIIALGWVLVLALLATPLVFLINYYIVDPDVLDMNNYGTVTYLYFLE